MDFTKGLGNDMWKSPVLGIDLDVDDWPKKPWIVVPQKLACANAKEYVWDGMANKSTLLAKFSIDHMEIKQ